MSTMSQDRFNNPKYIDWVKVKLSLQYAKEGLEPTTNLKVQTFHHNLSSTLQAPSSSSASAAPTLCHGCLKTDLKRQWSRQRFLCPGGICDGWLGLLQQKHVDPTAMVEWDNFDVSRLPTSPWECAKVYMPYGSGRVNCAGDADLAAILTLFLNCRHLASSLQNVTLCEKVSHRVHIED